MRKWRHRKISPVSAEDRLRSVWTERKITGGPLVRTEEEEGIDLALSRRFYLLSVKRQLREERGRGSTNSI